MAARTKEIMIDNGNGCLRTKLRNDGKKEGGDEGGGFFSGIGRDLSRSSWIGEGEKGAVWSALDISRVKPV